MKMRTNSLVDERNENKFKTISYVRFRSVRTSVDTLVTRILSCAPDGCNSEHSILFQEITMA